MDMKRLKKQMDFILEIDKEKNIKRQTLITDASRQETDAEHAWHLAVMCALLSEYSNEKIDVAHTMLMVLMHDLVEIDAGDTYAYDEEANKSKEEREQEEREYLHRIFPGGTAQKAAVEQQLKERLPREDKKAVMLYYILVKDAMTAGNGMSFEEAVEKVSKKQRILKLTPVMLEKVREVMEDNQ